MFLNTAQQYILQRGIPYWSREKLENHQLDRLREIVAYAYEQVPFYRERMDRHQLAPGINKLEDLKSFPLTEKIHLKTNDPKTISKQYNKKTLKKHYTTGTTGEPLDVFWTEEELMQRYITLLRCLRMTGWKIWHKRLGFGPALKPPGHWLNRFGLLRFERFSSMVPVADVLEKINRSKPQYIIGYPSCLVQLAQEARKRNLKIRPKIILSGGERLGGPFRHFLESVFQAEVFEILGSVEFGMVAFECRAHNGMHINEDIIIPEFLSDQGCGDKQLVLTSLINRAMPLIRYNLKDLVEIDRSPCTCGCRFIKISRITGRASQYFSMRDGTRVSATNIVNPFCENLTEWVDQYKMIQLSLDQAEIHYVRDTALSAIEERSIREAYRREIGDVTLSIIKVESIPKEQGGKQQDFETRIP